jgi:hypothetical protein
MPISLIESAAYAPRFPAVETIITDPPRTDPYGRQSSLHEAAQDGSWFDSKCRSVQD